MPPRVGLQYAESIEDFGGRGTVVSQSTVGSQSGHNETPGVGRVATVLEGSVRPNAVASVHWHLTAPLPGTQQSRWTFQLQNNSKVTSRLQLTPAD